MRDWEEKQLARQEGHEEATAQFAKNLFKKYPGITDGDAAELLGVSEEKVRELRSK